MKLPFSLSLSWTWPQVFALLLLALAGAFIAERIIGNAPKFGLLGSLVLSLLGAWIFINLPLDISIEPRLEDTPVIRAILGSMVIVSLFAFFRKQGARR
ncbi:MAG TPA: hypothetical protein VH186_07660 [Chloroflexia bacterium]|nr:hypothetical protein [Chloroflexia bacterium]